MAYNPEEDIKVSDLPEKTTDVVGDDKLLVIDSEDANILKQVDASKVGGGGSGTGDMLKSVYDKNNDGVVDDAEALGGKPASDYALSENTQDKLESGVNIKTINGNSILGPGNIVIQGGGSVTVDDALSTTSENPVQNKVITTALNSKANTSDIPDVTNLATKSEVQAKQDTLVSGTNIKTINNQSILGNGNIDIQGGSNLGKVGVISRVENSGTKRIYFTNPNYYLNPKRGVKMVTFDYVITLRQTSTPTNTQSCWGRGIITFTDWGATDVYEGQEVVDASKVKQSCFYCGPDGKYQFFDDCAVYYKFTLSNSYGEYGGAKLGITSTFDVTDNLPYLQTIEEFGTGSSDFGLTSQYFEQILY